MSSAQQISFDSSNCVEGNSEEIHLLPFQIEWNSTANVKKCFTDTIYKSKEKGDDVSRAVFRGRPLEGDTINLPSNFQGYVLTDTSLAANKYKIEGIEPENKTLKIDSKFDKFTYWNWDRTPTGSDNPRKLIDWLEVSQIIYEPI